MRFEEFWFMAVREHYGMKYHLFGNELFLEAVKEIWENEV